MTNGEAPSSQDRTAGKTARRFFLTTVGAGSVAAAMTWALAQAAPVPVHPQPGVLFPKVFLLSTLLLIGCSLALHRATEAVRREWQRPFRQRLRTALAAGTAFVGLQGYGLLQMFRAHTPEETSLGVSAFVFVFAALHALHCCVALLFLVHVTVQAWAGRYDHEYYWGVLICGWFWHALGVVWIAILGVFSIVSL